MHVKGVFINGRADSVNGLFQSDSFQASLIPSCIFQAQDPPKTNYPHLPTFQQENKL